MPPHTSRYTAETDGYQLFSYMEAELLFTKLFLYKRGYKPINFCMKSFVICNMITTDFAKVSYLYYLL